MEGKYNWKFTKIGGVTRVSVETGEDIAHLGELDEKLWTVLSCPVKGLEFDEKTLAMLDSDGDGKIRVNEIVAASKWLTKVLKTPDSLLKGASEMPLADLNEADEDGAKLLSSAKQILANLGLEKDTISVADASDSVAIFAKTKFNGDGIITPASTDDEDLKKVIAAIIATVGGSTDRSGEAGVTAEQIEKFYAACADYAAWTAAKTAEVLPYGENTEAALAACEAVKDKVTDYFMRCKLAAFDKDATGALDVSVEKIGAISGSNLATCADQIAEYPLARIDGKQELPFDGINPAWTAAFAALKALVLDVDFAGKTSITEAEWNATLAKFAPYTAWKGAKKGAEVESIAADVEAIVKADRKADLVALVEEDKKLEAEAGSIDAVNKLVHLYRDFYKLLRNYVTFSDFYASYKGDVKAIFQAGTLYVDQRSTDLCIKVSDMGKHGDMAGLSGMFILYCTCTSKTKGETINIAAVLTDGDVDALRPGMNAVFYDRDGLDWDATITKVVDNPISIRQAFMSPYKKLARTITDRINKSAAEKSSKVDADLTAKANTASVPASKDEAKAAAAAPTAGFDIAKFAGIFAAIGMAMGMIGAAIMAIINPWYNVLILLAVLVVCISGPSMFLAWQKLRKRNLGPVLNANGWAINSKVLVNIAFGATLTKLAKYPKVTMKDPFEPKKHTGRNIILCLVVLAAAGAALYFTDCLKCVGLPYHKDVEVEVVEAETETAAPAEAEAAVEEAAAEAAE